MEILSSILKAYFGTEEKYQAKTLAGGHINDTYRVVVEGNSYLVQRINEQVFQSPETVINNYRLVYEQLSRFQTGLLLPQLIRNLQQGYFFKDPQGKFWRLVTFLEDTHSLEEAENLAQIAAASDTVGRFLAALNTPPAPKLEESIPNFHYLTKRLESFWQIVEANPKDRASRVAAEIEYIRSVQHSIIEFNALDLPKRIVHNDPKISNLLFDSSGKTVAVIDWDTIMPGYLATDFGDMVRAMAVSASEEEAELDKVFFRSDNFEVICKHFLPPIATLLSKSEKDTFHWGPSYIVFEQLIRFLGDYLEGDRYYKVPHPEQNRVRAANQLKLHQELVRHEAFIKETVQAYL